MATISAPSGPRPAAAMAAPTSRKRPVSSLGSSRRATQTIILAESPIVLPPGTTTNSLDLHTETFDKNVTAGSASNNGHGFGNFTSTELNAVFTASGNAGVVSGSSPVSAAPFVGGD